MSLSVLEPRPQLHHDMAEEEADRICKNHLPLKAEKGVTGTL